MSIVVIIQFAVAALLALAVGIRANTRHTDYLPPEGIVETILLAAFLEDNFPSLCEEYRSRGDSKVEPPQNRSRERVRYFLNIYHQYREKGQLTRDELLPAGERSSLGPIASVLLFFFMGLLLLIATPVAPFIFWRESVEKENGRSVSPVIHPLERAHNSMQIVGALLTVLVAGGVAWYFLTGIWLIVVLAALCVSALLLIVCLVLLTLNQKRWKDWWLEKLGLALQVAAHQNNHDLYNRSLNLYQLVDKQSVLPVTGLQKLVLACFAIVQFLIEPVVTWVERAVRAL